MAEVLTLHQLPAFRNAAHALRWSDEKRLTQRFWRLIEKPPLDVTGIEDIDAHLAATFGILVSLGGAPDPLRDRLLHMQMNATLLTTWAKNADAAGQHEAAELHRRTATIVNRWSTEIGAVASQNIIA